MVAVSMLVLSRTVSRSLSRAGNLHALLLSTGTTVSGRLERASHTQGQRAIDALRQGLTRSQSCETSASLDRLMALRRTWRSRVTWNSRPARRRHVRAQCPHRICVHRTARSRRSVSRGSADLPRREREAYAPPLFFTRSGVSSRAGACAFGVFSRLGSPREQSTRRRADSVVPARF
jgi:hypothetical protein